MDKASYKSSRNYEQCLSELGEKQRALSCGNRYGPYMLLYFVSWGPFPSAIAEGCLPSADPSALNSIQSNAFAPKSI